MEPVLLKGGETVKSLSIAFLADLEEDWRHHGKVIFPILRAKYPQAYLPGIASLARIAQNSEMPPRRRLPPNAEIAPAKRATTDALGRADG
jgi:hypothetical protein